VDFICIDFRRPGISDQNLWVIDVDEGPGLGCIIEMLDPLGGLADYSLEINCLLHFLN
jgi:hypothetical protein